MRNGQQKINDNEHNLCVVEERLIGTDPVILHYLNIWQERFCQQEKSLPFLLSLHSVP